MKLEVNNYTKKIKDKIILDNVNLSLKSGNVYGFYGRNGSGKTMLFRAISTLIFPTDGDVLVDGKSIIKEDFDLRQIGILIEEPSFYPYLTGLENLSLLYSINHKKNDEYLLTLMKKLELDSVANVKYKEYSLGMKQKLKILQAIMEEQKIIILDEPTNGLDERGIEVVRDIIKELKKNQALVLMASHNKEDLKILCDKIYKMNKGKIDGEITL